MDAGNPSVLTGGSTHCPRCSMTNPPEALFCGSCGASFVTTGSSAAAAGAGGQPSAPPDQLQALQAQVASLQGQIRAQGTVQTDTAVRTALNSARIRGLIVVALIVVIVVVAGQSTGSSNGSTSCWSWVLRGSTNAYGSGGHGFFVCVG
jgi:hypothetical protein